MTNALTVTQDVTTEIKTTDESFWAVVGKWFEFLAGDKKRKPRTLEVYRYNLSVFKKWLDKHGITQATRQDIKSWQADMVAAKWSVATMNLYLATVRGFYKWLEAEYKVENITANISGWENSREHKRGFLSCAEMKRLLASVDTVMEQRLADEREANHARIKLTARRDKAILVTLMTAGLRTIEISRLTIADLTRDSGIYYLSVLGKKRDEAETVKISDKAAPVIREWLDAREAVDVVSDDSPLFCSLGNNSFGEMITSMSVSRLVKDYLIAAGLKKKEYTSEGDRKKVVKPVTAHSLRGSCATNAFLNGATLDQVKQQLRHKQLETTLIYLEEAEKSRNPVSDIIADQIF